MTQTPLPSIEMIAKFTAEKFELRLAKTQKLAVLCYEDLSVLLKVKKSLNVLTRSNFCRKI